MSNCLSFVGTLGRDAELKHLPSGSAILSFNVANNTGYGDNKKTTWYRVSIFGKRAEGSLKNYLLKGQQVFISGEMSVNEYKSKEGSDKFSLEVMANIVDLVGGKKDSTIDPSNLSRLYGNVEDKRIIEKAKGYATNNDFNDDIPF
jgi:single-strand DNA-binding protein